MAFDAASGQLLMFAGTMNGFNLADTWVWTGSDWMQLHPAASPPGDDAGQFAYDPATRQIVLFGGFAVSASGTTTVVGTWTWNGTTWTEQHPATSPPPESRGALAYDPALGKLVLFGGDDVGDTWTWNGSTWSQLTTAVSPPARHGAEMALDPASSQLILTGGINPVNGSVLQDTWEFGTGWTRLAPGTSAPPSAASGLAVDPGSGSLVLFGGVNDSNVLLPNQTWVWGPFAVTARSLPTGQTGVGYSQALQATGGKGTTAWTVSSGALPPGISLSRQGVLSGSATKTGTFTFTATATDASTPAQTASRAFALTVNQGPVPAVYVANRGDSVINAFALGATNDAKPVASLAGLKTTLQTPEGLALDATGRLYVADAQADQVDVFAAGASGNVAPVSYIAGNLTGLTYPSAVTLDGAGNVYVANLFPDTVAVYAPGGPANRGPVRTISGPLTGLSEPDALTVTAAGDLWVADGQSNALTEYAPGANGDAMPIANITGDASNLDTPDGLAQDAAGNLLVADAANPSIDTFVAAAATTSPTTSLIGAPTELAYPIGIDVDAAGREYVANQFGALTIYPAGAQMSTAPMARITGPDTGLSDPGAVAVVPPLHITTRRLGGARVGRRYHQQLRALLGRSPLRWRIARGRLPAGLHLTRTGAITGRPRHASRSAITVAVIDRTRPAMQARRRLRLTIRAHHG